MQDNQWYSRGYLPHFNTSNTCQFITIRLFDSLPLQTEKLLKYDSWCKSESQKRKFLETELDKGYGSCHLRIPEIAKIVENSLMYFNNQRYYVHAWVVMPNHVHTLIEFKKEFPMHKVLKTWKSYSARFSRRIRVFVHFF